MGREKKIQTTLKDNGEGKTVKKQKKSLQSKGEPTRNHGRLTSWGRNGTLFKLLKPQENKEKKWWQEYQRQERGEPGMEIKHNPET